MHYDYIKQGSSFKVSIKLSDESNKINQIRWIWTCSNGKYGVCSMTTLLNHMF